MIETQLGQIQQLKPKMVHVPGFAFYLSGIEVNLTCILFVQVVAA